MTPQQQMIQILYKAIADGVSKLIRNGLAFTVMTGVIGGLIWAVVYLVQTHERDRLEWKAELLQVKQEYSEEVNRLRVEVYECQERNTQLAIQLAEMKTTLSHKR